MKWMLLGTQFFGELGIFLEELTRLQLEFASTLTDDTPHRKFSDNPSLDH